MKIVTWNVNSLTVRLPRLLALLERHQPDIVCLQELKMEDSKFPHAALNAAGYAACCHGQKTYNGVAILSRLPLQPENIQTGIADYDDPQARVIAATLADLRVICVYVPNGQALGSDKYDYKLQWCRRLTRLLVEERAQHENLVLAGDFNIVPDDRDVWDPLVWRDQILCSDAERAAFRAMLACGLADSFRLFEQPAQVFSWWDYRQLGFIKNHGLRIDHILLSDSLAARCTASTIDRDERKGDKPSDHAPAIVEIRPL